MRSRLTAALLLAAPLPVVAQQGIAPEVDAAFALYAALPAKLIPVLEEAKDKASAEAAAPKLFELLPRVYDARDGLQAIKELDPKQTQLVQQKYGEALRRDWGKLYEHIYRLERARCYGSPAFFKQFQTLCMMLD